MMKFFFSAVLVFIVSLPNLFAQADTKQSNTSSNNDLSKTAESKKIAEDGQKIISEVCKSFRPNEWKPSPCVIEMDAAPTTPPVKKEIKTNTARVKNSNDPFGLNSAETDASMCQGDTDGLASYFPVGRFTAVESEGISGVQTLIDSSTSTIPYLQKEADECETILNNTECARRNRKSAEFLECHQANNWPTIIWISHAYNYCKKNEPKRDPDYCIEELARKTNRLGL